MKTIILSAHECRGTYQGKPYATGCLVVAHFDSKESQFPAYITTQKTSVALVKTLKDKTPFEATLSYDVFKRVTGVNP